MSTPEEQNKNLRGIVSAVLWIIAPALFTAISPFLIFLMLLWWIPVAILIGLQVGVFHYYLRSSKQKNLPWIIGMGLIIQMFLLVVMTSVLFQEPFLLLPYFYLIIPQLSVAVVLGGLFFLLKKSEKFVRSLTWLALSIIIGGSTLPYVYLRWKQETHYGWPSFSTAGLNYDLSGVAFRQVAKSKTTLGSFPRPFRIVKNSTHLIGITLDTKTVDLPFLDPIPLTEGDISKKFFFDIFHDRVFYVYGGNIYVFDIGTKQNKPLPDPIQKALKEESCLGSWKFSCNTRSIIGIHNDTLALSLGTVYAGTEDIASFNIQTGERIAQTVRMGYDISRIYLLWIDGKGYRLIIDSKEQPTRSLVRKSGGLYTREAQTQGNTMRVYLEDHPEPYDMTTDGEFMDRWRHIIFSGRPSFYFETKTPLLTLTTNYPKTQKTKNDNDAKFAVRNLYNLGKGKLGLEIEEKLVIVDIFNRTARYTTDANEIENLLFQAILLASDDEQQFQTYCANTNELIRELKNQNAQFVFCLM